MTTIQIQWEQYHHLWDQSQDDIERRVLYLGLRLPLDEAGWTLRSYSKRELMALLKYSWGQTHRQKFDAAMARLQAAGVLALQGDPEGRGKQRVWFAYAGGSTCAPLEIGVTASPEAAVTPSDGRHQAGRADTTPQIEVTPTPPVAVPEDELITSIGNSHAPIIENVGVDPAATGHDLPHAAEILLNHDSLSIMKKETHDSGLSPDIVQLLTEAGIDRNAHYLAAAWTLFELQVLVERVRALHAGGKIQTSLPRYLVGCLKRQPTSAPRKARITSMQVQSVPNAVPLSPENQRYAAQALAALAQRRQERVS
jgi:hypothetical protein